MAKNKMREWLAEATKEQAVQLAQLAKTSLGVLRQIAGGYRTEGEARTTPETARAIEKASKAFPELPVVLRGDLCPACKACEFYKGRVK